MALAERQKTISIDDTRLTVEDVNLREHPQFITVLVAGLDTDDYDRPGFAEASNMAKELAAQLSSSELEKDDLSARSHVTDVYGEFAKYDFEDQRRFIGIRRAAVRLFPSPAHSAPLLPGFFKYNDRRYPLLSRPTVR